MVAPPAKANAADSLWFVLLLHVCQQPVKLKQLRTLWVLLHPFRKRAPVGLGMPRIAMEYVRKKHKKSMLS